jgi:hypothetical protein
MDNLFRIYVVFVMPLSKELLLALSVVETTLNSLTKLHLFFPLLLNQTNFHNFFSFS